MHLSCVKQLWTPRCNKQISHPGWGLLVLSTKFTSFRCSVKFLQNCSYCLDLQASHDISLQHNDQRPHENHHLASAFRLLQDDDLNFMCNRPNRVCAKVNAVHLLTC